MTALVTLQRSKIIKYLIIAGVVAACHPSIAQSYTAIDSLQSVLKNSLNDTDKVNTLNFITRHYLDISLNNNADEYAKGALVLAEKSGFKKGLAVAYFNIGLYNGQQGNFSEALKNFRTALKINQEIGNKEGIANDNIIIGLVQIHWGNFPEALNHCLAALKISEEIGYKGGIADAHNKIGVINRMQGNYAAALHNHLIALSLMEEIGSKGGIGDSYNLMGMNYWLQGNYPDALEKYLTGLKFRKELGNKDAIAGSYNNIGELYLTMGNYTEALKNQMIALRLAEETGSKYEIGLYSKDIGKVYIGLHNVSKAKEYLTSALLLSKEVGDKENLRDTYHALSKLDSAMGNYLQALKHYKQYTEYKDCLLNETNNRQTAQLKEQFESEKKDKEIELLNKEAAIKGIQLKKQRQTKKYFIAGLILFAILSSLVYRNYHARQKLNVLSLRNKIASDLHDDIGSTLSSISIFSQMALEESKEVKPMLQTIGDSSRKMLDAMADIVWTIHPENDQFEKIIMRMRSFAYELLGAKQIDFRFVADSNVANVRLSMEARRNLFLIFKEATNNLVKYSEATKAMFTIKEENEKLLMLIKDNGKGFDSNSETQGNGLRNMKKRAVEMGAVLQIESVPGNGTTIQFELAV